MTTVNAYLRENINLAFEKDFYLSPDIPAKKLNNAVKAFKHSGSPSKVIGIYDSTLFGGADEGLLFTGERLIYRSILSDPISVDYSKIEKFLHIVKEIGDGKKTEEFLEITCKDKTTIKISGLIYAKYAELAKILNDLIKNFEDFKEEDQLTIIESLSDDFKIAYLKVIVNMAYHNDGQIDDKEFTEILLLITRLKLSVAARQEIRTYMAVNQNDSVAELVSALDKVTPEGHQKAIHISLCKDLIYIYLCASDSTYENFLFLKKNRSLFRISDGDIDVVKQGIELDLKLLREEVTDDQLVTAAKELSSKAAAVGTPIAAIYLSGSVLGLSASGITSGLASLGMGGILGLSGMVTGIGVVVLIGIGTYTGLKKLTGAGEVAKSKRRELFLNEMIKQTQMTMSLLMQDINYITVQLNRAIKSNSDNQTMVIQLGETLAKLVGVGGQLTERTNAAQVGVSKIRCAQFLDVERLKILTTDPVKNHLYDYIMGCYEQESFTEVKDGKDIVVKRLVVRKNLPLYEMDSLVRSFEAIGYHDMGEIVLGNVADVANKAKSTLAGLFS